MKMVFQCYTEIDIEVNNTLPHPLAKKYCDPCTLITFSILYNDFKLFDMSKQYIEETEELAMNALRDNRHILDLVARELLEKSRITGLVGYTPILLSVSFLSLESEVTNRLSILLCCVLSLMALGNAFLLLSPSGLKCELYAYAYFTFGVNLI